MLAATLALPTRVLPVLLRLNAWRNRWLPSEFPSLPPVSAVEDEAWTDYCLLAHGLADLLARCSPRGAKRHFPSALLGFRGLKQQMKQGGRIALPAQLLSDLCHEIAQYTDHATLEAAVRCLRRRADGRPSAPAPLEAEGDSTAFLVDGWAGGAAQQEPQKPQP